MCSHGNKGSSHIQEASHFRCPSPSSLNRRTRPASGALLPPSSTSFDSMNWRRRTARALLSACSGLSRRENNQYEFMPWHHQPPINPGSRLCLWNQPLQLSHWKGRTAVRQGFLLQSFCVQLQEKVRNKKKKTFLWKKSEIKKLPRCKRQTTQAPVLSCAPIPLQLPHLPKLTVEAFVLWGTEWNLPCTLCQWNSLGKLPVLTWAWGGVHKKEITSVIQTVVKISTQKLFCHHNWSSGTWLFSVYFPLIKHWPCYEWAV